jgi:D-amino-acid dehydrogenase
MVDIVGFAGLEPKRLALMKRQALETFLAGDYAHAGEWAGMRPATPAGVPLIGASAYRNLWLNLGHGALGTLPAAAKAAGRADRPAPSFH